MVAKSRVLDPISVIAFIFLISTTIVEFMTLLHSKKVFPELFYVSMVEYCLQIYVIVERLTGST